MVLRQSVRCLLYNSILSVMPGIEFKLLLIISGITGIGISIPVALLTGIPGNTVSALSDTCSVWSNFQQPTLGKIA